MQLAPSWVKMPSPSKGKMTCRQLPNPQSDSDQHNSFRTVLLGSPSKFVDNST